MNPRIVDNGIYSQSHHASREDLRNALGDKRVTFLETPDFWTQFLLTESVPSDTVESVLKTVQVHVEKLTSLAAGRNPLESNMYPPLDDILKVIQKQSRSPRFWKDHHTKYPGVDSGVFVSGLHGKDPASTQVSSAGSEKNLRRRCTKMPKIEGRGPLYSRPEGSDEIESSDDDNDSYRARKTPSQFAESPRIFDARKPDYLLLDANYQGCRPEQPLWRQIAVIMELKAQSSGAPSSASPESSLIVQCTDYARLHMSLRPFQRFSLLFSLCGTLFTAWLVDRVGVVISDNVDISKSSGAHTFIRALIRVTCLMTAYDVGMDPTVSIYGNSALGDFNVPRFVVTMPSKRIYITRGIPIWQSSSVFGRGTVVWNVDEMSATSKPIEPEGSEKSETGAKSALILKNAYRNKERIGESEFYDAIQNAKIDGLAVFREGGDISWSPDSEQVQEYQQETDKDEAESSKRAKFVAISASLHRMKLNATTTEDSIAHRLVLESKGKRLSEYEDLCGLLKGILSCVKGHGALYEHGILHRDISIGNVFLSDSSTSDSNGPAGFLADFDMAKVHDEIKLARLIGEKGANHLVKSTTGSITGTAQFMSLSLLLEHSRTQDRKRIKGTVVSRPLIVSYRKPPQEQRRPLLISDPRHDLQSFVWVFFYALCVKEMNLKATPSERERYCREYFVKIFGAVSFKETYDHHHRICGRIADCDESDQAWRLSYISDANAWPILEELMRAIREDTLDYKEFEDILLHYIHQLTKAVSGPAEAN